MPTDFKKKALLIVHQRRSNTGDVGLKLRQRGYSLDVRKPALGDELPKNMNDHDVAVIYGGPMSANDNLSFIKEEIDWIDIALNSKKPFLGICLGGQMLAKNLGQTIKHCSDKSCEIGFFDVNPVNDGFKIFQNQKKFFQWHSEGFDVPRDATLLAKGSKFPNQAFRYKNAYGIQFHPEVNLGMHLGWLYFAGYKLKERGAQTMKQQLTLRLKYGKNINLWLDQFLDNYLLQNIE